MAYIFITENEMLDSEHVVHMKLESDGPKANLSIITTRGTKHTYSGPQAISMYATLKRKFQRENILLKKNEDLLCSAWDNMKSEPPDYNEDWQ